MQENKDYQNVVMPICFQKSSVAKRKKKKKKRFFNSRKCWLFKINSKNKPKQRHISFKANPINFHSCHCSFSFPSLTSLETLFLKLLTMGIVGTNCTESPDMFVPNPVFGNQPKFTPMLRELRATCCS